MIFHIQIDIRSHLYCGRGYHNVWLMGCQFPSQELNLATGFPCGSAGKESTCNEGDLGSIPELGRSCRDLNHKNLNSLQGFNLVKNFYKNETTGNSIFQDKKSVSPYAYAKLEQRTLSHAVKCFSPTMCTCCKSHGDLSVISET